MSDAFRRLNPFKTPETQKLAVLFAVVYFAQAMWYLPKQPITIVLKDRGLTAGQVADFFFIATFPWLVKPIYGLLSDFVPIFGYRRRSYFLLTSALAGIAGLLLVFTGLIKTGPISTGAIAIPFVGTMTFTLVAGVGLFTLMALGLAFTDVLTDATMVENGQPRGLTGAFQSVQWAASNVAAILVGLIGGYLAGARDLRLAFFLAATFPLLTLLMTVSFVPEKPRPANKRAFLETWEAIRHALRERDVWAVAGFIFFYTFSPSFGPAFTFYQTDTLKFSQQFIGLLDSLQAAGLVIGAAIYAPLSRRYRLKHLIVASIGLSVVGTLGFFLYRDAISAIVIQSVFGVFGMITVLSFLDLAARACPKRVEATFFALLMSVYNGGSALAENVGARLYDQLGYIPLVMISAGFTALAWLVVPLVKIDRIEAKSLRDASAADTSGAVPVPAS
jgi:MFS family permease